MNDRHNAKYIISDLDIWNKAFKMFRNNRISKNFWNPHVIQSESKYEKFWERSLTPIFDSTGPTVKYRCQWTFIDTDIWQYWPYGRWYQRKLIFVYLGLRWYQRGDISISNVILVDMQIYQRVTLEPWLCSMHLFVLCNLWRDENILPNRLLAMAPIELVQIWYLPTGYTSNPMLNRMSTEEC